MSLSLEELGIKNTGVGYKSVAQPQPRAVAAPKVQANPLPSPIQKVANTASNVGGFLGEVNKAYDKTPVIGGLKRQASAGFSGFMQPVGRALGLLSNAVGGFAQGARLEAEKQAPSVRANKLNAIPAIGKSLVAGVANIPSGIKNNVSPSWTIDRSLTNDFKVKNPIVRATAGLATDLTTDPLNYINPASVVTKLGKFAKVPELASKIYSGIKDVPMVEKAVNVGDKIIASTFYGKGRGLTPEMMGAIDTYKGSKQGTAKYVDNLVKPLIYAEDGSKLSLDTRKTIYNLFKKDFSGANGQTSLLNLAENYTPEEQKYLPIVQGIKKEFEKLAQEQIAHGQDPKIFEKFMGDYFGKRVFTPRVTEKTIGGLFRKQSKLGLDMSPYQKRLDLPEDVLKKLGVVEDAAFGAAVSANAQKNNIEKMKLFKSLAGMVENTDPSLGKLLENKPEKYGALAGKVIPKNLVPYIDELASSSNLNAVQKAYKKGTSMFKQGKVIYSPSQLARNIPTSQMQAYMNPNGRADSIRRIPEAIMAMIKKDKYWQEANDAGFLEGLFTKSDFGSYLPDAISKQGQGLGTRIWNNTIGKLGEGGAAIQNANERMAKLQVFINERKAGKSIAEAKKLAEETGFDYGKVTPFIKKLKSGEFGPLGIPFATYGIKAAELTGKTLLRQPQRLSRFKHAEKAVESITQDQKPNEQYMPDYLKDSVRIPIKDAKGNYKYLNTKYNYPWGSMGDVGTLGLPLGMSPDPFSSEAYSQAANRDLFSGRDISTSPNPTRNFKERFAHASKAIGPSIIGSGMRMLDAYTKKPRYATDPTPSDAWLRAGGVPIYTYSQTEGRKFSIMKKSDELSRLKSELKKDLGQAITPEQKAQIRKDYIKNMRELIKKTFTQ